MKAFSRMLRLLAVAVATLKSLEGTVIVRSAARHAAAQTGDIIQSGDEIRVLPGSKAYLELSNGAKLWVLEDSYFAIGGWKKNLLLSFAMGEFTVEQNPSLPQGTSFKIKFPEAETQMQAGVLWGKSNSENKAEFSQAVTAEQLQRFSLPQAPAPQLPL